MTSKSLKDALRMGVEARECGRPRNSCPFPVGLSRQVKLADRWYAGWDAMDERLGEKN